MKKKRVISLLLTLVMAASFAACGNTDSGKETAGTQEQDKDADNESGENSQANGSDGESQGDGEEVTLTVLAGQSTIMTSAESKHQDVWNRLNFEKKVIQKYDILWSGFSFQRKGVKQEICWIY